MAREYNTAKLLDAWGNPNAAGDPIGVIATTYSFDPIFFEEECLGRFLNVQSDPNADGPIYLIELEEKMAGLSCASVLIDQHHCQGARNLRWDMIPARLSKGGVMHSKIVVLCWSNLIRIIVGSANITENGFRENQEIFGVLDYTAESNLPLSILSDILEFLDKTVSETIPDLNQPDAQRWLSFTSRLQTIANQWMTTATTVNDIHLHPLFVSPGSNDVFSQLKDIWRSVAYGVPNQAVITSPFFNPPEDKENIPSIKIWDLLSQRGSVKVIYNVPVDDFSSSLDHLVLRAPRTLEDNIPKSRRDVMVEFKALQDKIRHGNDEIIRFVHMKSIYLQNQDWIVYMIGSSNFTSSGLGFRENSNYEANLVYAVSRKNPKRFKEFQKSLFHGEKIKGPFDYLKEEVLNEDESISEEYIPLPQFFSSLILIKDPDYSLRLNFSGKAKPDFIVCDESKQIILDEKSWLQQKKPESLNIPLGNKPLPSGLLVRWKDSNGFAFWPLIVSDKNILPPPEEIRDLPLEILLQVITSARPLHQIIRAWKKKKEYSGDRYSGGEILDPHKRVDTSTFLLQRTRKISYALNGLRQRLERPVYTKETLQWRLHGPIGVKAIAKAIIKEAKSDEEKAFLLCEIALELSRIDYQERDNSLENSFVTSELQIIIRGLYKDIKAYRPKLKPELSRYIKKAFNSAIG